MITVAYNEKFTIKVAMFENEFDNIGYLKAALYNHGFEFEEQMPESPIFSKTEWVFDIVVNGIQGASILYSLIGGEPYRH